MPGGWYTRYRNMMISAPQGGNVFYRHGDGQRAYVYGEWLQPEIQVVIRSNKHESLVFDNFEIIGNDTFFDQITCETSDQSVTELIQDYIDSEYKWQITAPYFTAGINFVKRFYPLKVNVGFLFDLNLQLLLLHTKHKVFLC